MRCAHCDTEFTPKRTTGKYCSTWCRCAAWQATREDRANRLKGLVTAPAKEAGLTAEDFS
jgi:hypothetical protein